MKILTILFLTLFSCSVNAQERLLDDRFVDLRGQTSLTILKNSTEDTLKIRGRSFYYLPYFETDIKLDIPPNEQDTLTASLAYPDFIHFNSINLKILNAPGKTIKSDIKSVESGAFKVSFSGDFMDINNYYLAYQNHFNGFHQEGYAYYRKGDEITNFDNFPAIADSINNVSLAFLNEYRSPLPEWFLAHEEARLNYNAGFRKYNVKHAKEFSQGVKYDVKDSYYDFEKTLPLKAVGMLMNTDYLYYVYSYIYRNAKEFKANPTTADLMAVLDRELEACFLRDALKMRIMYNVYQNFKSEYDSIFPHLSFYSEANKKALDSITTVKNRYPIIGETAPSIKLRDASDNIVSLKAYEGKPMIINFWASWCQPCLKELPHENILFQKYASHGLVIINICVETKDEKWRALSKKHNLKMVNLYATEEDYLYIKRVYNVEALPRSILIGRDLKVLDNYFKKASQIKDEDVKSILKR